MTKEFPYGDTLCYNETVIDRYINGAGNRMIRIAIRDAFGRGVYGFLKKPLAYGKLEKKLDAVLSDFLETEAYVTCTNTGCKKNVLVSRILYIQASGNIRRSF